MEPELSGIFWVKMVAKNIVLGSPGTHFMHMRVKETKKSKNEITWNKKIRINELNFLICRKLISNV